MEFKLNDRVKYYFPDPGSADKNYVSGEITFIGETKIEIICDDNSKLSISFKNFSRIVPVNEELILA